MKSRFWSSIQRLVTVAVLVISSSVLVYAQSTTDGAIGGTVYDSTGAVVANAKVSVHNNGTNAEQIATSDASGYYRVTGLQSGTYTVTITGGGLAPYKAQQVIVSVGSVTDLSPRLSVAGTSETVDVTAEAPQINTTSPEFAPTLNQVAISNLPINGGRWSSFALLTPGVVSNSSGFGLLSFRGISSLLNNNTVDGADNNQAFFSEERGRTRAGYSTPKAAIEEFQVNTSNYSSEYGRAAGGVINTVTKSGTNSIHGEAYFYDRDNVWGAINPFAKLAVPSGPNTFTQVPYKPTDWRKISGFGLGGPAIKDKLFWNMTFDWYKRNFPGTAISSNPTVFFGQGDPNAASQTPTINTIASKLGVSTAQARTLYGNEFNGLVSMLGPTPREGEQYIIFPKVDWNISQKNHASFTFNRMRWGSPAGIQTQATNTFGVRSFGNDFVKDTWGIAKLNTFITASLSNEVRYQYGRDFEYEFAQQPTPYELSRLVNSPTFTNPLGLPPQISITNGFTFGVPTFLQRAAFPDESTYQVADTLTWTTGKHNFKFGTDVRRVHDNSQNLRTQFGSYSYSSVNNYILDALVSHGCGAGLNLPCYNNFSQAFGPIGFEFDTTDTSLFASDDWKIMPRLSLSMGLRYEREILPDVFSSLINPALPQTAKLPQDKNNFGPRMGFAYDVTGNGKMVVRGGYGIYFGRIINSTIFNAMTNTGMPGAQKTFSVSPSATSIQFPQILPSAPTSGVAPNVTFFTPNFQAPQIHQFDLIVERDLGWGTALRVSYLGSLGRELPNFVDTNIAAPTKNVSYLVLNGGPLAKQSPTYTTTLFSSRLTSAFGAETAIFSGANSSYNALSVDLIHRMSHHIQFNANYTWAHALDFGQNESTFSDTNDLFSPINLQSDYGNSIYDVRHRVVLNAVANSPWKTSGWLGYLTNDWTLAPIFQFQTGLPFSLSTSGNAPGGISGGGGVNGSGGAFRIDNIGRNTFRFPSTYVQDLRLSKTIKVQERYSVELLADVFNLANHTNVTGVTTLGYSVVSSGTVPLIGGGTQACSSAAPCLNFNTSGPTPTTGSPFTPQLGVPNSANSNFIYSPRQLQLGVRVKF